MLRLTLFSLVLFWGHHVLAQSYSLQGDATYLGDDCYRLTGETTYENGAVWYADQIMLDEPFDISFQMNLGDLDGNGADGICFVLQTVGNNALGQSGGGLGFLGFAPAFAIEFDTWQNIKYGDPVYDHIGMVSNGDVSHTSINAIGTPVQTDPNDMNVEDGLDHTVRITWDPISQVVEVYWDCVFRTAETIDLINDIFNGQSNVFWGFTAATGGSFNNQTVCLQENILTTSPDAIACEGGSLQLSAGGDPNGSFEWTPSTYLDDPNSQSPICTPEEDITYTVTYNDLCGTEITAEINITVEALTASISGSTLIDCNNDFASLTASNNLGNPSTYTWESTDGSFVTGTNASTVVVNAGGTYLVTVNYDGQCEVQEEIVVEENFETLEVDIEGVAGITCNDVSITMTGVFTGEAENIFWTDSNGLLIGENLDLSVSNSGEYYFTAINAANGCPNSAIAMIENNVYYPEILTGQADSLSCRTPLVQIEGTLITPANVSIDWSTTDGMITDGQNTLSPIVSLPGIYTVTATIPENGCASSANIEVFEDEEASVDVSSLIFPNVFSPNNDGTNDSFIPFLADDPEFAILPLFNRYELKVYNRWGNLVFDTEGQAKPWSGNLDGYPLGEGVYYFMIDYDITCGGSPDEPISGTIQIMRQVMKLQTFNVVILWACMVLFHACKPDRLPPEFLLPAHQPILPDVPYDYEGFIFPPHFSESAALQLFENLPSDNPLTDEGATLGRVLFYDRVLSHDGTISCGSCHRQEHAFSDPRRFSEGINGAITPRNSMALFNLQYSRDFFWDLRTTSLENQVLEPIQHPEEMGLSLAEAIQRVEQQPYYPELFEAAFGTKDVTADRISKALSQFVRSMRSFRSNYDDAQDNDYASFTSEELLGKELFYNGQTRCNQCHMTTNFFMRMASNNGLELDYSDEGVGAITGDTNDMGLFKVPSLRNLGFTAPYMHDGRFNTLEEVIVHYNGNIVQHENLGDQLTQNFDIGGVPIELAMTDEEVAAMVAFLHTLDDELFVTDPRFGDPFKP